MALITELSIFAVKYFLTQDILVGYYTSASTLARILPSLFRALPFTFLPSISKAVNANDSRLVRKYIGQGLRYSLLILVPAVIMIGVNAASLIELIFSSEYLPAAIIVFPLTLAFLGQAIFLLLCSILNGSGLPKKSMYISGFTLIVAFLANIILVPRFQLPGAAFALLIASFFGVILAAIMVYRKHSQLLSFLSLIRILIAAIVIYVVFTNLNLHFIFSMGFGGMGFYLILFLFGEIGKEDIQLLKSIIRRS
jgi:O-antigen/teichoic acid export membrane protein